MKRFPVVLAAVLLTIPIPVLASENIIHDDGTGAQITFNLPTRGEWNGREVEYTTFRLVVVRQDRFLLRLDLPGRRTDDGAVFSGRIIIPSEFVDAAEILLIGSPRSSSLGLEKKLKVREFRRLARKKSWTDHE